MLTRIEALHYKCLSFIGQDLSRFQILVGANATGKTTFLDVVALLSDLMSLGLREAVEWRGANFLDLVTRRKGTQVHFAIEARIPSELRRRLSNKSHDTVRYEVVLGVPPATDELSIVSERVVLKASLPPPSPPNQSEIFPMEPTIPESLATSRHGSRTVVSKSWDKNDRFNPEVEEEKKKRWVFSYKLGPSRSALANLPEDQSKFPVATWFKGLLMEGAQQIVLNSLALRKASPPGVGRRFKPDGSNLPWVVHDLESNHKERLKMWVEHLRSALPDLRDIRTLERADDKHRYLMLDYDNALTVPSWMASDGTLRLLALTLPAYLPDMKGIFLVEEPENGIHPKAVETMYQSLSSLYDAQVLMATHSTIVLNLASPKDVLCFAKAPSGATDIINGALHPALQGWRNETSLGTLLAGGVLG